MPRYARTNLANRGFKDNTPGGWISTNGPVWWYGSDRAYLVSEPAGRAAITRATNLIVNRIAAVPWSTSRGDALWLQDPCRCRDDGTGVQAPYPLRQPRSVFWGSWIRSALSWGMGYLLYQLGSDGQPQAGTLRVVNPQNVDTNPAWPSGATRTITSGSGLASPVDDQGVVVLAGTRYLLVELRNPTTPVDPETGATPGTLAYHAAELGLIDDQLFYASAMYGGGGVPSGYLKVNTPGFTQAQADQLLSTWNTAHATGSRNTAVLSASTEYTAIAVSPVDAALADMKRLSLQDVANAFGIPGYMIGAPGTSMTYSNVEMEKQGFYEFTLLPWAVAVEETLSALLPSDRRVEITPGGERTGDGALSPAAVGADNQPGTDVPPG